jgi:hypothetical protein
MPLILLFLLFLVLLLLLLLALLLLLHSQGMLQTGVMLPGSTGHWSQTIPHLPPSLPPSLRIVIGAAVDAAISSLSSLFVLTPTDGIHMEALKFVIGRGGKGGSGRGGMAEPAHDSAAVFHHRVGVPRGRCAL